MTINKVSLTGAVLGTASLIFPLISLKKNRVDDGQLLSWFDTGSWFYISIILVLFLSLILLSLFQKKHWSFYLLKSSLVVLAMVLTFYLIGPRASLLIDDSMPYGRISPSSGFWIMLGGIAVILHSLAEEAGSKKVRTLLIGILLAAILYFPLSGAWDSLSLMMEFSSKQSRLLSEISNHLRLSGTAVLFSLLIGIPLGLISLWRKKSEKPIFFFLNTVQTIPSLALFGLLIAPLSWLSFKYPFLREMGIQGIGNAPALIALTLYALLPIARNTYTGLSVVDPAVVSAGRGMGMSRAQLFFFVELPMALPVILTGIRISAIQAVGNTAVAALIGAGGLGAFIFQGLGQGATDLILLGVIPLIILAVLVDRVLSLTNFYITSPGLRQKGIDND